MPNQTDYYEFATVLDVRPESQAPELYRRLQTAPVEPGMRVEIRTPSLALFVVEAQAEFLAVERAEKWLQQVAGAIRPTISLNVNTQPSHEV